MGWLWFLVCKSGPAAEGLERELGIDRGQVPRTAQALDLLDHVPLRLPRSIHWP